MPLYECNICLFESKFKNDLTRHLKTKKHIKNLENIKEVKKMENKLKCNYCEQIFCNLKMKKRHEENNCINNKDTISNRLKEFEKREEEWIKEKKELYTKMDKLLDKVGDTNIQNNKIAIGIDIKLNNYGTEDMSHITDKIKTELLKMPYGAIPKMIQAIHFNSSKPQNKNIILPNKKENFVKIFSGNKWIYRNKDDTLLDLVDSKYMIIDDHYENCNDLEPNIKKSYTKFRQFYDEKDKELVEKLKKECELILLNNR